MKRHHWLLVLGLVVVAVALFGLLLIVTAPPAVAPTRPSTENLDDATMQVAHSLYCPVCPGVPLDVCETQACAQWRDLIRTKLQAGETREQIQQYFVAEYGQRVLGAPEPQGFNLGIYLAPAAGLLAGAVLLYFAVRGWLVRPQASGNGAGTVSPEYRERIERELKETE